MLIPCDHTDLIRSMSNKKYYSTITLIVWVCSTLRIPKVGFNLTGDLAKSWWGWGGWGGARWGKQWNVVFHSAAAANAKLGGSTRPSWGRGSNTFIIIHLHRCIHVTKYSMQIFLGFSQVLVRGGTILRRGAMQYASLSHSWPQPHCFII